MSIEPCPLSFASQPLLLPRVRLGRFLCCHLHRPALAEQRATGDFFHFPPILTSPERSALLYTGVSDWRREPRIVRPCPAAMGRDCAARGDGMASRATFNFGRTDSISRKAPIANGSNGDSRPSPNGENWRLYDLGEPNVPRGTLGGAKSGSGPTVRHQTVVQRVRRPSPNGGLTDQTTVQMVV